MRHRPLVLALCAPIVFGCVCAGRGGGGGRDSFAGSFDTWTVACIPSDTPTLALGIGQRRFEHMPAELVAESGSQGGQHLWLAFQSTGLDLSSTSIVRVTGVVDGVIMVDQTARLAWTCHDDGVAEVVGLQVPVPDDVLDNLMLLTAEVTDPEDRVVQTSLLVHVE